MTEKFQSPQDADQRLDEALAESFPASDPPFFVGSGARPGPKQRQRRKPGDFGQNFGHPLYSGRQRNGGAKSSP
jgi:hypothetical protein